nr:MAG TPA: hypothetical protein [Caudoviricetes sp.]DAT09715.1 MAG TPA: hypothetical protein [Caudoviricetes sp.]
MKEAQASVDRRSSSLISLAALRIDRSFFDSGYAYPQLGHTIVFTDAF